jgi:hypothetical protein
MNVATTDYFLLINMAIRNVCLRSSEILVTHFSINNVKVTFVLTCGTPIST